MQNPWVSNATQRKAKQSNATQRNVEKSKAKSTKEYMYGIFNLQDWLVRSQIHSHHRFLDFWHGALIWMVENVNVVCRPAEVRWTWEWTRGAAHGRVRVRVRVIDLQYFSGELRGMHITLKAGGLIYRNDANVWEKIYNAALRNNVWIRDKPWTLWRIYWGLVLDG